MTQAVYPLLHYRMLRILLDEERAIEEQLLAFRGCDPMSLPNLTGVAGVPLKAFALLDDSLQPSHPASLYMAVAYDDKLFLTALR
jgi:hypothetical protein